MRKDDAEKAIKAHYDKMKETLSLVDTTISTRKYIDDYYADTDKTPDFLMDSYIQLRSKKTASKVLKYDIPAIVSAVIITSAFTIFFERAILEMVESPPHWLSPLIALVGFLVVLYVMIRFMINRHFHSHYELFIKSYALKHLRDLLKEKGLNPHDDEE